MKSVAACCFITWLAATCDTISGMASATGTLLELRLETGGLGGRISCPPGMRPAPGQYLTAASFDFPEALPVILYPSGVSYGEPGADGSVEVAAPLPPTWTTGMKLLLRGPLGKGFQMPVTSRRIALASLEDAPARLLPLARLGLAQHAAVAIYSPTIPSGLPEEVEVSPLDLLPEALAWADYLALDVPLRRLAGLRERLGLKPFQRPNCLTQVLVITEMPCSGLATCGICAVATQIVSATHKGTSLACIEGPVFDFTQLEGG